MTMKGRKTLDALLSETVILLEPHVIDWVNRKFDDVLGMAPRDCLACIVDSHGAHMSTVAVVLASPYCPSDGTVSLEFSVDAVFTVLRSAHAQYIGIFNKANGKHVFNESLDKIECIAGLLAAGTTHAWVTNRTKLADEVRSACVEADEAFR
jgi:hypothetical protein